VTSGERLFSSTNAAKPFGGRAPPRPAGGAHNAPPDPLAGRRGAASRREGEARVRKGKVGKEERGGKGGCRFSPPRIPVLSGVELTLIGVWAIRETRLGQMVLAAIINFFPSCHVVR
jgi:hypothetical protein